MSDRDTLERLQGLILADKYRLISLLGAGGMGYIYEAEQLGLGRAVAVKLLRRELARNTFERFRSEAMAASRINHPNAVAVYDFGVTGDDIPYLVMEYLRGRTLAARIEEGPLEVEAIVTIGAQVLSALDEAHHCGVIHCDLTADNVILERMHSGEEFAKVIDFGLARCFEDPGGAPLGTPEYMAPEQIRGEKLGPTADVYAAGALLYEMIVGRTPFAGGAVSVIVNGHLHAQPASPREIVPQCPEALSDLVSWALSKRPHERPASAREMRAALLSVLSHTRVAPGRDPTPTPRRGSPRPLAAGSAELPVERTPRRRTRLSCDINAESAPFIGRAGELGRVIEFCRGDQPGQVMRISGPPGAGKARLLLEAAHQLAHQAAVFVVAADPSGLRTPWFPVLSMLELVLGLGPKVTIESLIQAVARCGLPDRDVPGLAEIFDLEHPGRQLELAVRRREAHAAALHAVLSVERRFPRAVLAFADAHEYDAPSRQLLEALSAATEQSQRARIVYTTANPADSLSVQATIDLGGLAAEDARELVIRLAGGDSATVPASAIAEVTAGQPAAIEQLAGWLELGNSMAASPSLLVDLISVRFNRLPAGARRALQATAVHGSLAPRWLVCATAGSDELDVDAGGLTGLLVVEGDDLTIPSELVASVASACTPADVRRSMHRRALEALDGAAPSGVLGHHAEEAGDLDRARAGYVAAGRDAERRFDDHGAAAWYGRATQVARRLRDRSDADTDAFVEIAVAAADLLRRTGRTGLARGLLDEAEALRRPGILRARLGRCRAGIACTEGDHAAAAELLRPAIGAALRAGDRTFLAQAYLELADELDHAGRPADAIDELAQGIDVITQGEWLRATGAPTSTWYLGLRLAERLLDVGRVERAEQVAADALAAARLEYSARGRGRAAELLARICEIAGDPGAALRHRAVALDEMRALGDRRSTAELLIDNARTVRRTPTEGERPPELEWSVPPARGLRLAGILAREIGWDEGIELSKARR